MRIGEMIRRRARASPRAEFWREGGRAFTYGQLDADSERVAAALAADGLAPGRRAAICAGNGYPYAVCHFGAAKAGLVLAHLGARAPAEEIAAQAERCDAEALFFGAEQQAAVEAARPRLPRVRRWLRLPSAADAPPLPGWAQAYEPWSASAPDSGPGGWDAGRPDDEPFQILFTSGTTGVPKGALISHRAKLRQGMTHAINLGLLPGDRILSALPLHHQFAQWLVLVCAPLTGATVAAQPAFSPAAFRAALERDGITHLPAVPTLLYRLLDDPQPAPAPDLRMIVYGAAPMDPARIRQVRARFPKARLFQGFGQTETGYCLGLHDADHDTRPESVGRPDVFSQVRLVDGQGRDVPPGAVGEIVARTPYLMNGYLKDPRATAEYFAFGREWGRTGDLARRDGEGFFTLAGRKQELVISGGVNLYPAEVERVLLTHPAVAEAAVVGVPDAEWGESLHAAVILKPGAAADPAALEAHCRAALAGPKVPRRYSFHADFPRTAGGKVRKFALRQEVVEAPPAGPGGGKPAAPPRE